MHELSAHRGPENGYLMDLGGVAILDRLDCTINVSCILDNLYCLINVNSGRDL